MIGRRTLACAVVFLLPVPAAAGAVDGELASAQGNGDSWVHRQALVRPDPVIVHGFSGAAVAIDGDVIVAGSLRTYGWNGVVEVFERDPATGLWSHAAQLRPGSEAGRYFGRAVAVQGDTIAASYSSGTEVYMRNSATGEWVHTQTLPGGGPAAISGDTLVVSQSTGERGAIGVFTRDAGTGEWSHVQDLTRRGAVGEPPE